MMTVGLAVLGLFCTALGWLAKDQSNKIASLQKELSDHKEDVAKNYVQKVDYKSDVVRIFDALTRLEDKLDRKLP